MDSTNDIVIKKALKKQKQLLEELDYINMIIEVAAENSEIYTSYVEDDFLTVVKVAKG